MRLFKEYLHRLYPYQLLRLLLSSRHPRQLHQPSTTVSTSPRQLDKLLLTMLEHLHNQPQGRSHPQPPSPLSALLGFDLLVQTSHIPQAGRGVFLKGHAKKGSIVAIYPGLILDPWEPKLIPSLANRYALRMTDGTVIDGKATGISGWSYRSIVRRDRIGPYSIADMTWMDLARHAPPYLQAPRNPLAVGQLINNAISPKEANVTYHEHTLPPSTPISHRQFLPNIRSSGVREGDFSMVHPPCPSGPRPGLPLVLLIATRDLHNEELYSTYMEPITFPL
ncbi:MAG: hypothetical protein DHS80DRAFT_29357 [Piptocephalis tieghemiana]|nr:MAG: hypothetical protein DHS80DRAFT_29357 [Piptocephalis tieghemiana]